VCVCVCVCKYIYVDTFRESTNAKGDPMYQKKKKKKKKYRKLYVVVNKHEK